MQVLHVYGDLLSNNTKANIIPNNGFGTSCIYSIDGKTLKQQQQQEDSNDEDEEEILQQIDPSNDASNYNTETTSSNNIINIHEIDDHTTITNYSGTDPSNHMLDEMIDMMNHKLLILDDSIAINHHSEITTTTTEEEEVVEGMVDINNEVDDIDDNILENIQDVNNYEISIETKEQDELLLRAILLGSTYIHALLLFIYI